MVSTAIAPEDTRKSTNAEELKTKWRSIDGVSDVIAFYSHKSSQFACFSNFYKHAPFNYKILVGEHMNEIYPITFSEKAIMLNKASLFHDDVRFQQILKCDDPAGVKKLGRQVADFNDVMWNLYVCNVARDVIVAKFTQIPQFAAVLRDTHDAIIAEATAGDKIWGIGLNINDPDVRIPSKWKGANILGYVLMEARQVLNENRA